MSLKDDSWRCTYCSNNFFFFQELLSFLHEKWAILKCISSTKPSRKHQGIKPVLLKKFFIEKMISLNFNTPAHDIDEPSTFILINFCKSDICHLCSSQNVNDCYGFYFLTPISDSNYNILEGLESTASIFIHFKN